MKVGGAGAEEQTEEKYLGKWTDDTGKQRGAETKHRK